MKYAAFVPFSGGECAHWRNIFLVAELPTKDETLETNKRYLLLSAFLHWWFPATVNSFHFFAKSINNKSFKITIFRADDINLPWNRQILRILIRLPVASFVGKPVCQNKILSNSLNCNNLAVIDLFYRYRLYTNQTIFRTNAQNVEFENFTDFFFRIRQLKNWFGWPAWPCPAWKWIYRFHIGIYTGQRCISC